MRNDSMENRDNRDAKDKISPSIKIKNYYPASITILLNTRIMGHTKEIYYPNMTIPNISSNSKTVFFNPLIKLDKNIVQTIPKGKPESFVYEQFFSLNLFNSLLIRSQYYPQPKRSLEQATEEGIVDNNIQILLDTLFASDKPFYINKKRYTSYGYTWNKGDWVIQSINSSKIRKKFYNYYQRNTNAGLTYPSRYGNIPTATVQSIVPSVSSTTLYQQNQLLSPASPVGNPNVVTYHQQPYLQTYQTTTVPYQPENPMFESFDNFEQTAEENVLHGPESSITFGDIITDKKDNDSPAISRVKKTRMSSDKKIAAQIITTQPQTQPQTQPPTNKNEYPGLINQFLFYSFDGFKNGFIQANRVGCSNVTSIDNFKNDKKFSNFYTNKIQPWKILSNDGNGDCLFYAFCQLLNSSDYKNKNFTLKTRLNVFNKGTNKDKYYDKNNNYTVAGLRNIVADFILYTDQGNEIWNNINSITDNTDGNTEDNDRYIVKNNISKTLNNIRTCADETNRTLAGQKELVDSDSYYWGDENTILIIEQIFKLKTIIIHKPDKTPNSKTEIYTAGVEISNLAKIAKGDYIEINYLRQGTNSNSEIITERGYLIEKNVNNVNNTRNPTITILKNNDDTDICKYEKKQYEINGLINSIYKIAKYKIYFTSQTNESQYQNYVYLLYDDEKHYEAMVFNKRNSENYIFNDNDIYAFHPYIIYMIFIYCYMVMPDKTESPFYNTSLLKYLFALENYYSNNNITIKNNRLLLTGGGGHDGGVLDVSYPQPSAPSAPSAPLAPIEPSQPTQPTQPTQSSSTWGWGWNPQNLTNSINDKLNQQLNSGKPKQNIPAYYANPNLSYYVVVDLELFPGDKISDTDKRNLACQIKFDNVRKSYADFLGYQYQPSLLDTDVRPTSIDSKKSKSNLDNNSSNNRSNNNNNNNNTTKKNTNNKKKTNTTTNPNTKSKKYRS